MANVKVTEMRKILLVVLLIHSNSVFSNNCIEDLRNQHSNDGVEEIKEFPDLNGDKVLETIVLLRGSMTSRYGVIYIKDQAGCYTEIYSGSENVGIGTLPDLFLDNNRIKNNSLNGFLILRDSSWDGNNVSIIWYAFDKDRNRYREIFTTIQNNWFN
jgi:hypothetical protein